MDIKITFLASNLDNEVYIEILTSFEELNQVCKLNKALYNLKQAPRVWFKILTSFLTSLGYKPIPEDPSIYRNKDDRLYIAIYVNNLLIFSPNKSAIAALKENLSKRFHILDLGPVAYYLDLEV